MCTFGMAEALFLLHQQKDSLQQSNPRVQQNFRIILGMYHLQGCLLSGSLGLWFKKDWKQIVSLTKNYQFDVRPRDKNRGSGSGDGTGMNENRR